jgi:hypothetical protein
MGKRGEEAANPKGSSAAEMELLRNKVTLMEENLQKQSLEFRSEMASSQSKIQS